MKIPEELKEAHKHLSKINVIFLEFAEKNPGCFKKSNFSSLELRDDLIRFQAWPTFINSETRREFKEVGVRVFDLIKSIPRRLFDNNPYKISTYFNIPPNLVKQQLEGVNDENLDTLLSRGDFVISHSSGLKCIEYNVSASLGGWKIPGWELLSLNTPLIDQFLKEYGIKINNANLLTLTLEHLTRSLLDKPPGTDTEINLALVTPAYTGDKTDTTERYLNQLYGELLSRKNSSLKGGIFMCDYPHLTITDDYVFYKDKKIHIIVEMYTGIAPPAITELFKMGHVRLVNGPITPLMSNKLMLALLSENDTSDAFTSREKKTIDKHIPWTRKIVPGETRYRGENVRLEFFVLSHREKLVIKTAYGYGGRDVYVGRKTPANQWKQTLEKALNQKNWLVQEFVECTPALYQTGENGCGPHEVTWGFYVFGSQYGGVQVRVLPAEDSKGVINAHQGATVSVVFETDE